MAGLILFLEIVVLDMHFWGTEDLNMWEIAQNDYYRIAIGPETMRNYSVAHWLGHSPGIKRSRLLSLLWQHDYSNTLYRVE